MAVTQEREEEQRQFTRSKSPYRVTAAPQDNCLNNIKQKYKGTQMLDENDRLNQLILERCKSIVEGCKKQY